MTLTLSFHHFIGASMFGALTQLAESQVPSDVILNNFQTPVTNPTISNIPIIQCTTNTVRVSVDTDDPLRDLVLCDKIQECEPNKLNALAVKAANLSIAEEVVSKPGTTMKSLAGIFAGTETFVKKVEETIKKKYAALDPTDSEGCGGKEFKM